MAKSSPKYHIVYLTEEAYRLLSKHIISGFIHIYKSKHRSLAWIKCKSADTDGIYLRITAAEPLEEEYSRPANFLIRQDHVLFVSSSVDPDKIPGFHKDE